MPPFCNPLTTPTNPQPTTFTHTHTHTHTEHNPKTMATALVADLQADLTELNECVTFLQDEIEQLKKGELDDRLVEVCVCMCVRVYV